MAPTIRRETPEDMRKMWKSLLGRAAKSEEKRTEETITEIRLSRPFGGLKLQRAEN